MNICIFADSFLPKRGGMEYVIHHLANALVEHGHNVTVIAARVSWGPVDEPRKYQLARYGLPLPGMGRLGINHVSAVVTFALKHMRQHFDVVHCHSSSFAGSRARRIKSLYKNIALLMTPHGEDVQRVPEINRGLRLNKSWDKKIRRNLNAADIVTAISLSIERELNFLDADKVRRVPNGVQTAHFNTVKTRYLRSTLGIPDDKVIILSIGRNHMAKGYAYGIEAVSVLINLHRIKNIHYIIVGRGVSAHADLVERLDMGQYVTLIEEMPPENIQQCYSSADVFFSPSIIEGLSLVSIEAVSSGLPLVVTDVPGNIDIVQNTQAGLIAKSTDVDSMAMQLKQLTDASVRSHYVEKALANAKIYDWSKISKRYIDVYIEAVARVRNASR